MNEQRKKKICQAIEFLLLDRGFFQHSTHSFGFKFSTFREHLAE